MVLTLVIYLFLFSRISGIEPTLNLWVPVKMAFLISLPFTVYGNILRARSEMATAFFRELSQTDPLTGLLNRRAFVRALSEKRPVEGCEQSIAMVDIDHFKQVNDRFGHEGGDFVLRQFAVICRECIGADDILSRLGGEEFVMVMHCKDIRQSRQAVERLRDAVARNAFDYRGNVVNLTISVGLARYREGDDMEFVLRQADILAYEAKSLGRNRVSFLQEQSRITAAA